MIEIAAGENNAVFIAKQMMHTKNVKFEVRKGTRMHFRAPGCTFERDQVAIECVACVWCPLLLENSWVMASRGQISSLSPCPGFIVIA